MKSEIEQKSAGTSPILFVVARIIVGVAGLLLCVLGGAFLWSAFGGEAQWLGWAFGAALILGGVWFIWAALKPNRENVADMCTTIVARLLAELF